MCTQRPHAPHCTTRPHRTHTLSLSLSLSLCETHGVPRKTRERNIAAAAFGNPVCVVNLEFPRQCSTSKISSLATRKQKPSLLSKVLVMSFRKNGLLSPTEEKAKLNELRTLLGPLVDCESQFCTDACFHRYLRATNWSKKKAAKMIKDTLRWREHYKPQQVKWDEIAKEAETGKIYRANFCDRDGKTVLVMRPGVENTSQLDGQIRYLVYCMENAIMHLPPDQEQMVWLVDFEGWNMSMVPLKTARETAHVLQNHYPERLAYAILYNPPKVFEMFWNVVRPFLDPNTQKKVKFVYTKDGESQKLMESLFDLEKLECAFGGRSARRFNKDEYATIMREDDVKLTF